MKYLLMCFAMSTFIGCMGVQKPTKVIQDKQVDSVVTDSVVVDSVILS